MNQDPRPAFNISCTKSCKDIDTSTFNPQPILSMHELYLNISYSKMPELICSLSKEGSHETLRLERRAPARAATYSSSSLSALAVEALVRCPQHQKDHQPHNQEACALHQPR